MNSRIITAIDEATNNLKQHDLKVLKRTIGLLRICIITVGVSSTSLWAAIFSEQSPINKAIYASESGIEAWNTFRFLLLCTIALPGACLLFLAQPITSIEFIKMIDKKIKSKSWSFFKDFLMPLILPLSALVYWFVFLFLINK